MSIRTQIAVTFLLLVAGLGLIAVAVGGLESAPDPAWTTIGTVTRCVDGDTLEVEIRRTIRVRLLDAWAPEAKIDNRLPAARQAAEKAAGLASKENLRRLCEGQQVIVQIPTDADGDVSKVFTLGRVLGRVWLTADRSESLSEKQVKGKFATREKRKELN